MKWLQSRTLWTLVLTAVVGAIQATQSYFDPATYTLINTVLLAIAGYFRINVRVQ